jgi:hypothetical protein
MPYICNTDVAISPTVNGRAEESFPHDEETPFVVRHH